MCKVTVDIKGQQRILKGDDNFVGELQPKVFASPSQEEARFLSFITRHYEYGRLPLKILEKGLTTAVAQFTLTGYLFFLNVGTAFVVPLLALVFVTVVVFDILYDVLGSITAHRQKKAECNPEEAGHIFKSTSTSMRYKGTVVTNSSQSSRESSKLLRISTFDVETADWKILRTEYLDRGIPFILKSSQPFSTCCPPESEKKQDRKKGIIRITLCSIWESFGGIDEVIGKILPNSFPGCPPMWFTGNYKSGLAHVDLSLTTCNFYWMKRGTKDVVIVPPEITRKLSLVAGGDGLHLAGSSCNHDYLRDLESYYRFTLQEGSLLVFNNCSCLHHFTNLDSDNDLDPISLSVRMKYGKGADPRVWHRTALDPFVWWRLSSHAVKLFLPNSSGDRPQEDI